MKRKPISLIVIGLCVAGLPVGLVARRSIAVPTVSPAPVAGESTGRAEAPAPVAAVPEMPRSTDTVETLAALPNSERYSRLAMWLVDASEQDIAAYWAIYSKGKRDNESTGLVFLNWTRLNPQGAIDATAGTEDEDFAWWAWACHDPQGSLAAALTAGPELVIHVARGLGEFHPAWLRAHFDKIPEEARQEALSALAQWGDAGNPLEMLEFSKEHGMGLDLPTFRAFVSKDPWAALEWAKKNRSGMDPLIAQLAEERPDELARLAAQSPSGEIKRKMEAALFANLIKTDPEAAIAQAKAADAPRIAAERFAAVGLALVKTDPARAFELTKDLFTACPDALMTPHSFQVPGSRGGWSTGNRGVRELLNALLTENPVRLMDTITATSDRDYAFDELSEQWLERDVAAYAEWAKRQTDPSIHDDAANKLIGQLQRDHQYRDAVEWIMTLTVATGSHDLGTMLYQWGQINPAEPREWLEAANLPEEKKQNIRNLLRQ
ncbi:MAG: hypothetical protein V4689_06545 [Verrucomicrobiota bacterium]